MNSTDDFLADYEGQLRDAATRLARGETPGRTRRPTLRGLAPVAAIGAAVALAVAVPALLRTDARDPEVASTGANLPSFSVLDRPSGEGIPDALVSALSEDPAIRAVGARWSDGRLATEQDGVTVALVPGATQLCLVVAADDFGSDITCAGIAEAGAGELMVRIARGDGTIVAGAMPDGVAAVSLGDRVAPVEGNAYALAAPDESGPLRWDDGAGGRRSSDLPPSPVAAP